MLEVGSPITGETMHIRELLFGYRFPRGRETDTMLVVAALITGTTLGGGLLANIMWNWVRLSPGLAIETASYCIVGLTILFLMMRRLSYLPAFGAGVAVGLFYLGFCSFKVHIVHVTFMTLCYLVYLRLYSEVLKSEKPKINWR